MTSEDISRTVEVGPQFEWPFERDHVVTGAELHTWLEDTYLPRVLSRWDRQVSRYERIDVLGGFCSELSGSLVADARKLGHAGIDHAIRSALERVAVQDSFGTKPLKPKQRRDLIVDFWTIVEVMMFSELARQQAFVTSAQPVSLGAVTAEYVNGSLIFQIQEGGWNPYVDPASPDRFYDSDENEAEIYAQLAAAIRDEGDPAAPEAMEAISQALRSDMGFDLVDITRAWKLAKFQSSHGAVMTIPLEAWNNYLLDAQNGSGYSSLVAAASFLSFDARRIQVQDLDPRLLRHQRERLTTSPILISGEWVILVDALLDQAFKMFIHELYVGDWPYSNLEELPQVKHALELRKKERGAMFEAQVAQVISDAGYAHATAKQNAQFGRAVMRREVDHVVIDPDKAVIWVLEDKDIFIQGTLRHLAEKWIPAFVTKEKSYSSLLQKSIEDIEVDPAAVVEHVMPHPTDVPIDWAVRGVFVVRDGGPKQGAPGLPFPIVRANSLAEFLRHGGGEHRD